MTQLEEDLRKGFSAVPKVLQREEDYREQSEAVVVNVFAGPGTGKSTTAAGVFSILKQRNYNAEFVHEYAKDLTWEERSRALAYSPYVAAKQAFHVHRVLDRTDVVITDSPILMGLVYQGEGFTSGLYMHILATHRNWNTVNIFLKRNPEIHPYREAGRNQTEEQAQALDQEILDMLVREGVHFMSMTVEEGGTTAEKIADYVEASKLT